MPSASRAELPSRAFAYAAIAALVVGISLLLWYAISYVLLVFFGVLLAILLRAPANWLAARTAVSPTLALAIVALLLVALLGTGAYFFGHAVAAQSFELGERLPQVIDSILQRLRQHEWGTRLLELAGGGEQIAASEVLSGAMRFAGSALEVVTGIAIVIFLAAFLALQPQVYVEGALRLVPIPRRERMREVIESIGGVLERWLVGQAVLMLAIFILSYAGLMLLGAPLALPLALLAGLLNFIPYVGPIASAVPAVLVGFSESAEMAGYIALLWIGLQSVEGYILEPLIQNKAVYLPPALILVAQMILGLVAGPLGIVVATPFAAALSVAVRMLYVEDALGDRDDSSRTADS
jgi:predicted PurR-regulated permease PerM